MFGTLALWIPISFLAALAAKFWMEPHGYRLRSVVWKLVMGATALVCIFLEYGSIGVEARVSFVALLMSLKILEAHTTRELQVMVLIAWVLCLCDLLLSQDLAIALFLFIAFTLLLVVLIQFHRGATGPTWAPVLTACKLLGQALPLILVLFLAFPRITTPSRFQILQTQSSTGFSDRLDPGSVASLAHSSEVAFRAEFPEGRIPAAGAMYWRGAVMSQCNELEWRISEAPQFVTPSARRPGESGGIRQWITIEPHNARWMFALDWPDQSPSGATLGPGNCLVSDQPIRKPRRYEVKSFPELREPELRPGERRIFLQVPPNVSPAVSDLVQSWLAPDAKPRAIVNAALHFFRTEGFRYSLSPGEYQKHDLDTFLFRRRIGFCEHYAASFATLMRLAGIPARVVVGYLGGEYNDLGRFFVVRQQDTHAWCEVWFDGTGWIRVDPTSAVAPERVNLGLNSFLERRPNSGPVQFQGNPLTRTLERSRLFGQIRLGWQTLNYLWDTSILSFDGERQESLLEKIGLGYTGPISTMARCLGIVAAILAFYAVWMGLCARSKADRVKALYQRFCGKLARRGAARGPAEGPFAFAERAARLLPNESEQIRHISKAYIDIRYSPNAPAIALQQFARDVKTFDRLS
jgi:transglutaminase-like putative cysteine protease